MEQLDVDPTTSTFYLMAQPKFAQLIEALTSVSSEKCSDRTSPCVTRR